MISRIAFVLFLFFAFAFSNHVNAQFPMKGGNFPGSGMISSGGGGRSGGGSGGKDSLSFEKRNFNDDKVSLQYRFLDSARYRSLDSTIRDYFDKIPLNAEHIHLGNNGTATQSLLFSPLMKAGWDHGFHAYDVYNFDVKDTKFLSTNKPFTQLTYLLGGKSEQHIGVMHTQNITPDWNAGIEYRLITSPGFYKSQNTNHKNIRFSTNYTSKDRRYNLFLSAIANGLQSSENGGIANDSFIVNKNKAYNDVFNIPTNLAIVPYSNRNFFSVKLQTGNRYTNNVFLLRQQYDFGKKDSVYADSVMIRYFLPTFRLEHTLQWNSYSFKYLDIQGLADSSFYKSHYGFKSTDTVAYFNKWGEMSNDFSIIQFPDPKNPLQFLKLGASLYNYKGNFNDSLPNDKFFNVKFHGEYRNRTKNRKWDMLLYGELFSLGRNLGDYDFQANLKTFLGKRWGYVSVGFKNVNRTPSYLFKEETGFPIVFNNAFNKENTIQFYGTSELPEKNLKLSADVYLLSNFVYMEDFSIAKQNSSISNVLRIGLNKVFVLKNKWKWYTDVYLQKITGNAQINLPLLYLRNRFAYEGSVFANLALSTGLDIRYYTPYKADNYSPVLGQFFYQSQQNIAIRPDVAAYLNFRILTFTGFTRLENLNTVSLKDGFGFKQNNAAHLLYYNPGLLFRLGVVWDMVN